jgi:hypothetical protein
VFHALLSRARLSVSHQGTSNPDQADRSELRDADELLRSPPGGFRESAHGVASGEHPRSALRTRHSSLEVDVAQQLWRPVLL